MNVLRVVATYDAARKLGAERRGSHVFLGSAVCLSVLSIRAGAGRGWSGVERIDDPDGLLTDELRAELMPMLVAGQ